MLHTDTDHPAPPAPRALAPAAKRALPCLRAGAIGLVLALTACTEDPAQQAAGPLAVRVATVESVEALATRHFAGRVDAVRTVDLAFEVGGRIVEMPATPGSFVPKGELVAALDPVDFELAVRGAEVQRDRAQKEHARARVLLARKSVSEAAYDRAEAEFRLADVALDQARRNLAYARLEVPFDALVTRRWIEAFTSSSPSRTSCGSRM